MTEDKEKTKSGVSRREFITGAVGSAAALGAMTTLMPGVTAATPGIEHAAALSGTGVRAQATVQVPTSWSQTADVVVVGTGYAGLAAAIAANDAGAKVLVLEKLDQAHEGGNGRVSGQWLVASVDMTQAPPVPKIAEGAAYWQAMTAGTVDDPTVFAARSQGYWDNIAWVKSLGANLGTWSSAASNPGPNSKYIQAFACAVPGAPVQSNGFPVGSVGDYRLWNVFRGAASARNIQVLYETPATDLIQDPNTKEILGVKALAYSSEVLNIKANRAVILACGSIEFAFDLQKQFYPFWPIYTPGTPGNTGDGIRMAQKVGAALWHMNAAYSKGFSTFIIPGTDPSSGATGGVTGVAQVTSKGILVNKQGNRFNLGTAVNGPVGGFGNEVDVLGNFDVTSGPAGPDFDSIPCWSIFDDTLRKSGALNVPGTTSTTPGVGGVSGWWNTYSGYKWSADNSVEVAKGWILSANDLNTLAATIAADPDNGGKMTGAQLTATVNAWNTDCANKTDAQLFTQPATWTTISTPPYYAIKLWPTFDHLGTGAGPRRNLQCQIVDPDGNPIPRLYEAGELGGFYYFLCTGGEHNSDGVFSGRVAGNNAASETPWS